MNPGMFQNGVLQNAGPTISDTLSKLRSHVDVERVYTPIEPDGLGHEPAPEIDRGGD